MTRTARHLDSAVARIEATGVPTRTPGAEDVVAGVAPGVVVTPTSTDEVAAVMRAAADGGLTVVARGAGTKLTWGMPPHRVDVLIDLHRLDRIVEHASGDLVVVTQAGVRLADLQRQLGSAGQHLAVDETIPGCTVGGVISTASSGPQRHVRGTVRDLLIGATFVRADGKIVHAGGRVVKNVAGYDIGKLLVGSYGTLGVVTEAIFRLHPLPVAHRIVTFAFGPEAGPVDVYRVVARVLGTQTAPSAIELDWPDGSPPTVTVLLEGSTVGVDVRAATLASLADNPSTVGEHLPAWWGAYPWAPDRSTADDAALKLTFALSGCGDVLDALEQLRAERSMRIAIRGAAGVGVLYAGLEPAPTDGRGPDLANAVEQLRAICTRHGGAVVVLDTPAALARELDRWGPVPALSLMRRVKDEFDPDHRLAPGRFVGGI